MAGVLAVAVLPPSARAQAPGRPLSGYGSAYYPRQAFASVPGVVNIGVQTTVTAPDGGNVTLGGYSPLSQGRAEAGVPVLGRVPYGGRSFGNVGYGRSAATGRASVRVRVIGLREEEFRQTGYRSNR
jgi:type II secretory pathway component GspD/PulD (secretin)